MTLLDPIDKKLLFELQIDSKQSIKQLAEKVNLSVTPVHERIKKLESSGIIKNYAAVIDPKLLGKKLLVYCQVTLVKHQGKLFEEFEEYVANLEEVLEASYIAGSYDFLLKLLLDDMDAYQNFVVHKISQLEIISQIKSSFVIRTIKNTAIVNCL
ncbi:Lrp/AsnC family transcriptional regulator [Flavobacterium sp. NKUCC04_CG]|uniref:Lrp/AsnC family transcriptional regulator n=1 Tax=Flavobacterium sp. NKUCC04_CG TaxID=2842121 RepID=UPI001C5B2B7F|nr:Lrp/AsnC family transcriptional regulator [Flavobacterium sp. NKUCC04_CG]MBW3518139.1 Lrp/AsnC family transcriptional regulator [Flavobacterium sp. NKUCC04_CG]